MSLAQFFIGQKILGRKILVGQERHCGGRTAKISEKKFSNLYCFFDPNLSLTL